MSNNPFFSYTRRDYETSRMEGISKIPLYSNGIWTDTNTSDPGVIILDYIHALIDMMQYYQDHNALEAYLSTAKERKNIFMLAKQLGYEIKSSKGASADITFTLNKKLDHPLLIPKNTKVSTAINPPIDYITTKDAYIYPGTNSVTVPCIQGSVGMIVYTGTGKSSLDNSLDPKDQFVTLPASGIDISSISIRDNHGEIWKSLEYIVLASKDEKAFEPTLTYNNNVIVNFGSGERGYCPKPTDELYISYIYNLGSKGVVGANTLTQINYEGELADYTNTTLSATNLSPSSGGSDPESSRSIVQNAPSVIKTNYRAVTLSDYEVLAKRIPGVKDAKAYDIKNAPDLCQYYEVKVLIIPDSTTISDTLREEVYNDLVSRSIPPVVVEVLSPEYYPVDIYTKVIIENNYYEDDVKYNINKVLSEYFDSISTELGAQIIPNMIIPLISSVSGVRYVERLVLTDTITRPGETLYVQSPNTITLPNLTIATLGKVDIDPIRRNS